MSKAVSNESDARAAWGSGSRPTQSSGSTGKFQKKSLREVLIGFFAWAVVSLYEGQQLMDA